MHAEYKRISDRTVVVTCRACKRPHELCFTRMQELNWKLGEYIQRVAPGLSPGERELFISGYCNDCFESLFAHDEEGRGETKPRST